MSGVVSEETTGSGNEEENELTGRRMREEQEQEEQECRICRDSSGTLLQTTCRCNSVVHAACLRRWLGYRADALFPLLSIASRHVCEICRHPIDDPAIRAGWALLRGGEGGTGRGRRRNTEEEEEEEEDVAVEGNEEGEVGGDFIYVTEAVKLSVMTWWENILTVESCLCLFLFVLAIMGHALFVLGLYEGASTDEHSVKRIALALANAVLTVTLLFFAQKVAARWLRDAELGNVMDSTTPHTGYGGAGQNALDTVEEGRASATRQTSWSRRCSTVSQMMFGVLLAVVAAVEIFLLVRELPLDGLT